MDKKRVAQEKPGPSAGPKAMTEQELVQAVGGVVNNPLYVPASAATNPLYTPLTQGGTNPLYQP